MSVVDWDNDSLQIQFVTRQLFHSVLQQCYTYYMENIAVSDWICSFGAFHGDLCCQLMSHSYSS